MFRFDRFFSLSFIDPLIRINHFNTNKYASILMYHSISNDFNKFSHPYYETNTSPKTFSMHMAYLNDNGYTVLPIHDVIEYLKSGSDSLQKVVAITFDDGFYDFYSNAFPILESQGFPSTVFLPTEAINTNKSSFSLKSYLSWKQVQELHSRGVSFGSHTVTHPKLVELGAEAVRLEIKHSKEEIENNLSAKISSFAYPYAFPEENAQFVSMLRKMLISIGYENGVTTKIGQSSKRDDPYFMRRIPINEFDDLPFFRAKISGAYNWLHTFQYLYKKAKVIFNT